MAKYRAKDNLFVAGRQVAPGETFESDHAPGEKWEPLDEAAHAAVASYIASRKKNGNKVDEGKPLAETGPVEIPADWKDLRPEQRINLARKLGAPVKGTNTEAADSLIEAELAKRAEGTTDGQ